jgi:hypothetical protein
MNQRKKRYILQSELPGKAVLIQDLHDIAHSLGKTPTKMDLRKAIAEGRTYHESIYNRVFGTWSNALRAAYLPLNVNQEFTREELLEQLHNLSNHLKRKITEKDVLNASKRQACARPRTFVKEFGSMRKALEAGDVKHTKILTDKEMLEKLSSLAEKLGRIPSISDVDEASKRKECPGSSAYLKRFGGHLNALRLAHIGVPQLKYTKKELLQQLRDLADELGHPPTYDDVLKRSAAGLIPGTSTYQRFFGGLAAARKAAGIPSPPKKSKTTTTSK